MKRVAKLFGICLAVVFCLLAILSFLSGGIIEKNVLPYAEELLGVPVKIDKASLNLLSGTFTVKDLTVGNPDGFEEPHVVSADKLSVNLSLLSLIRGRLVVSSCSVDNFTLHVVRNSDGAINANYFAERLQTEDPNSDEQSDDSPTTVPPVLISTLSAELRVRYVDHAFTTNTLDYAFLTKVKVEDISNFGEPDDYGTIMINGHLENNPKVLSSALIGRVATLSDPLHPTFDVTGQVKSIHVPELDDISRKIGIYAEEFTIDTPFKCTEGRLRGDFILTLKKPLPLGKLAKKIKNTQLPPVITVTVPIRGTVEKPRIDWFGAVLQSLLGNALENLDAIMNDVDLSEDAVEKQIDNAVESLKGLFKKRKK